MPPKTPHPTRIRELDNSSYTKIGNMIIVAVKNGKQYKFINHSYSVCESSFGTANQFMRPRMRVKDDPDWGGSRPSSLTSVSQIDSSVRELGMRREKIEWKETWRWTVCVIELLFCVNMIVRRRGEGEAAQ